MFAPSLNVNCMCIKNLNCHKLNPENVYRPDINKTSQNIKLKEHNLPNKNTTEQAKITKLYKSSKYTCVKNSQDTCPRVLILNISLVT